MKTRDLLRLALTAIEEYVIYDGGTQNAEDAMIALREYFDLPEKEPVAYLYDGEIDRFVDLHGGEVPFYTCTPLYTKE